MPMIECPHCRLRQYAAVTQATLAECGGCGRPLEVKRSALIAPVVAAERKVRSRLRHRVTSSRP